ncbi:uncharacterized protein LOC123565667 isoform X2 [Mercenaria mercenaria]|uniref:uncharacterized protein LOC123565667 isoform X2 n=1 Tax=Mercenaria mercenaria TaxID=6596 RepID=UPI00234E6441|nr:uncharacterized protein LOC123565667 isoform X2 [Mercenaria mercenaria]
MEACSARSDDIIVRGSAAHEILFKVNRFGEVLLIQGQTMNASVHYLQHNDVFTIGQRKFKWKYPHKKDTENVEHTGEVMHVSDENDKVEKTPPNEVQELVSDKELATCDEIDFVNAVNTMGLSNYYTDTEDVEHTGESMGFFQRK